MFSPKYTLTAKLSTNLREIERFYGRLEGMKIPAQLLLNLESKNLVQSTYISNSIEGNPLNLPEVTNLLLDGRVATNRSEKEVKNYFEILKGLEGLPDKKLSTDFFLSIHENLLTGVNDKISGKIRNNQVIVGNYTPEQKIHIKHNPPFHDEISIKRSLDELTIWIVNATEPPILTAGIFHHQFVFIHPFIDGNGRVCRLSTALYLLSQNYLINKYFVLDDYYDIDREKYSDMLHSADYKEETTWLEYFTDGVKFSLQSALAKVQTGLTQLNHDLRPTAKEQNVLNLIQSNPQQSSTDIAKQLNISRQQAFNLLKSLTDKGFLEKKGKTKNSYYVLK